MNWISTNSSSNLSRIRYDEDTATLEVEFNNGHTYQYFDVPVHVFEGLRDAVSHGQYLHQNIKGVYRYARL